MQTRILLDNLVSQLSGKFEKIGFRGLNFCFHIYFKAEPFDWPPHESYPFQDVKFAGKKLFIMVFQSLIELQFLCQGWCDNKDTWNTIKVQMKESRDDQSVKTLPVFIRLLQVIVTVGNQVVNMQI